MEKLKQTYYKKYPHIRLYLDDIQEIHKLFLNTFSKCEITAEGYKLNDFSEILQLNKAQVTELKMVSTTTDYELIVEFSISTGGVHFSVSDDDALEGLGVGKKIDEIISKRHATFHNILDSWWFPIVPGPLFAIGIFLLFYSHVGLVLLALCVAIWILILLDATRSYPKYHSLVYLVSRHDKTGFFQRHKDQILLHLLNSIITGLIGLCIGYSASSILKDSPKTEPAQQQKPVTTLPTSMPSAGGK